ncbi:MAG: bifunctional adenosylcobinamide kinase/adenosylcobinamide-phosphate guanylyltransferase [Zetaproteobacteria bacterium]|nr:bifunctional adenosylcobinamide kinase/adenosylcobinamide-phosphate guanylyltransferase [Pseudobdellovibrionaceae bacterium]
MMNPNKVKQHNLYLVGGGVRSGKSNFALELAKKLGKERVFVATAQAWDQEMKDRIARHQTERADDFAVFEAPTDPSCYFVEKEFTDVILLDCLTLWISNLMMQEKSLDEILDAINKFIIQASNHCRHLIIVTNEVGLGVVPESAMGRQFRDITGFAHQLISRQADHVYFATMGLIQKVKPAANLVVEGMV